MTIPPDDQTHSPEEPTQAVDMTSADGDLAQEHPTAEHTAIVSESVDNNLDESTPVASNAYAVDPKAAGAYAGADSRSQWTPTLIIAAIVISGIILLLLILAVSMLANNSNNETPTSTSTSVSTSSTSSTSSTTTSSTTTVATTAPTTTTPQTSTAPTTTVDIPEITATPED